MNRAKGRRDDPYPGLSALRKRAMFPIDHCYNNCTLIDQYSGDRNVSAETVQDDTTSTLARYGPMLIRLKGMVEGAEDGLQRCRETIMQMAGDVQGIREDLMATVILANL